MAGNNTSVMNERAEKDFFEYWCREPVKAEGKLEAGRLKEKPTKNCSK